MARIEHYTWDTGDWEALVLDGRLVYEGYSIPGFVYLEMLEKLLGPGSTEHIEVEYNNGRGPSRYQEIKHADRQ